MLFLAEKGAERTGRLFPSTAVCEQGELLKARELPLQAGPGTWGRKCSPPRRSPA